MWKVKTSSLMLMIIMINSFIGYDVGLESPNLANIFEDVETRFQESKTDLIDIVERNARGVDRNNDHIADYLMSKTGDLDLLLTFYDDSYIPKAQTILGLPIIKKFGTIPTIQLKAAGLHLMELAKLPGIAVVEENLPLVKHLAYSTSQIGVRSYLWDQGLSGSTDQSIAIVDTGIDFTHPAFQGRIIASYNALDQNQTLAIDSEGHGTHVAGIAAGVNPSLGQFFSQTARGTLPQGNGNLIPDILWANVNITSDINVGMEWADPNSGNSVGTAFIAVIKFNNGQAALACNDDTNGANCYEEGTGGSISATFTNIPPGDYLIGFGNADSAGGQSYEGWAELSQDSEIPSQKADDGYESHLGVAHSTNIVAVKVLDELGGDASDFLEATRWIIENRMKYNITVVNFSLGVADEKLAAIDIQVADLVESGLVVVAAAGNSGVDSGGIFSPASAEEAITVGAVNRANEVAFYSSNGHPAINNDAIKPDVVAPGGSTSLPSVGWDSTYSEGLGLIVSSDSNEIGFKSRSNDLIGIMGTSMATPHISGLAAILAQSIEEQSSWTWTSDDVYRIKRAIMAGTFEVANIGSQGGEGNPNDPTNPIPDQTPELNRISKDYVEGWGMVDARAAYSALTVPIQVNFANELEYNLNDPFKPKVSAWSFQTVPNIAFEFSADVDQDTDVDLLVFDANNGETGELILDQSSTNGLGIDEKIIINHSSVKNLILVVRAVETSNNEVSVTVELSNPEFIPKIDLISPMSGSFLNSASIQIEFLSTTGQARANLDGLDLGLVTSGYVLNNLNEGPHILTLTETNDKLGISDTVQIDFVVDLTNPVMVSDLANLDGLTTDQLKVINVTLSDNFELDRIEILLNRITFQTLPASITKINLYPYRFIPGNHLLGIQLFDKAGNSVLQEINISFTHTTFLVDSSDREVELGDEIVQEWFAGSNDPLSYEILLDDNLIQSASWNGQNISYLFEDLDLGIYNISLLIATSGGQELTTSFSLTVIDTTNPIIIEPSETTYDATNDIEIEFSYIELKPEKLIIEVNESVILIIDAWDGDFADLTVNLAGDPGTQFQVFIRIDDSSANFASTNILVSLEDLTPPLINQPIDLEFNQGSSATDIRWEFSDKFITRVEVTVDDNLIVSSNNPIVDLPTGEIIITKKELNELNSGNYRYVIMVFDLGTEPSIDVVNVFINAKESGGPGFIGGFSFVLTLVVLSLVSVYLTRNRVLANLRKSLLK